MSTELEGILETALYVSDLEAAEDFYGRVLGLEIMLRQEGRHVFFRCGAGILLIFNASATAHPAPADALPVPPHGATGPGHACFRVSREKMDAVIARLRAGGVAIEADFHWPNGARSIYFRDPAGNSLECAEPRLWNLE